MTDFRDLIDTEGLAPEEEARLRRVHELLLLAGPPAELPPALERVPAEGGRGEVVDFPAPRRRAVATLLLAAALAAIAFGGGYLFGHAKAKPAAFAAERVVPMHSATGSALAVLKIARPDAVGNWPMEMQVRGLPEQAQRGAYYELWLTRNGRPDQACGVFRVHGKTTTVILSVPYSFKGVDGWVVTRQGPGQEAPGPIVLTT